MPNITINTKTLDKLFGELQTKNGFIAKNEEYVRGANPYILGKQQEKKPDNRVPVALAKVAVETMSGYAGRAGDIDVTYDLVSIETEEVNDPFIDYMRQMDAYNKEDLETAELYEESLVQGDSFELWWVSDKKELTNGLLTAEFKIVPNSEILLIYNKSLKKELLAAIHFLKSEEQIQADIYYPLFKETWIKKTSDSTWVKQDLTDKESKYPYTTVPVIQFKSNRRTTPLFQAEKPLIDSLDEMISKSMNEIDRFNAVITLLGNKIDKDFADKLKEGLISIIDDLNSSGENAVLPQYLSKDLGGVNSFFNELADRLERLFHKVINIADVTAESFAGQQSGLAIAFKLMGMEFKASQIETYFNQGLMQRLFLYGDVYNASTASVDVDNYQANVHSMRNLPVDLKAKAEVAQLLTGILSEESLLKMLPKSIVDDVKKEMERKKEQIPEIDLIGGENPDDA